MPGGAQQRKGSEAKSRAKARKGGAELRVAQQRNGEVLRNSDTRWHAQQRNSIEVKSIVAEEQRQVMFSKASAGRCAEGNGKGMAK